MQPDETPLVAVVRAENIDDDQRNLFVTQSCLPEQPSSARQDYLRGLLAQPLLEATFYIQSGQRLLIKAALFSSKADRGRAYLGCYEVADGPQRKKLVQSLLLAVKAFARDKSYKKIYGPVDCNT
jgi:hypothetical protein